MSRRARLVIAVISPYFAHVFHEVCEQLKRVFVQMLRIWCNAQISCQQLVIDATPVCLECKFIRCARASNGAALLRPLFLGNQNPWGVKV